MTDASSNRVRYLLMELGHADVLGRYEYLTEAWKALVACTQAEHRSDPSTTLEFGIFEVNDAGAPVGDVIRITDARADASPNSAATEDRGAAGTGEGAEEFIEDLPAPEPRCNGLDAGCTATPDCPVHSPSDEWSAR